MERSDIDTFIKETQRANMEQGSYYIIRWKVIHNKIGDNVIKEDHILNLASTSVIAKPLSSNSNCWSEPPMLEGSTIQEQNINAVYINENRKEHPHLVEEVHKNDIEETTQLRLTE